jgi:hypothetical protein
MATAHDSDRDTLAAGDSFAAADIRAREAADKRVSLSNKDCQTEGGWGPTSQRVKVQSGVFNRYLDGSSVRITARSFYQHLIDLANAAPRQGRKPSLTSFQKKKRQPTPAELDGLKRANQRRHEENVARERGEAKAAVRT